MKKKLNLFAAIMAVLAIAAACDPIVEPKDDKVTLPLSYDFSQKMGDFVQYSVVGDDVWAYDSHGYLVISGYDNETQENRVNEDWLISPEISFAGVQAVKMTINHVVRYFNDVNNDATVWVSENYKDGDPNDADWTQVTSFFENASDWELKNSEEMDLTAFAGKKVRVAFKYLSETKAGTWEIKSVKIENGQASGGSVIDKEGTGKEDAPYNVANGIANQGTSAYVEGYIVGVYNFDKSDQFVFGVDTIATSILIADETGTPKVFMPVQLPSGDVRKGLNLKENPDNLGQKVVLYGSLDKYCGKPGLKSVTYAKLGDKEFGSKPADVTDAIFNETLMTEESFNKFTVYSVKGDFQWVFDAKYGAKMSGFDNDTKSSLEQEDWLITPAMDLNGKDVVLSFDHARGPAAEITTGIAEGWYTVWVSSDYTDGDPNSATWTQIEGVTHGESAWGYVSSGELVIPSDNLKANARIAFKYICTNEKSATWEIKNVVVR